MRVTFEQDLEKEPGRSEVALLDGHVHPAEIVVQQGEIDGIACFGQRERDALGVPDHFANLIREGRNGSEKNQHLGALRLNTQLDGGEVPLSIDGEASRTNRRLLEGRERRPKAHDAHIPAHTNVRSGGASLRHDGPHDRRNEFTSQIGLGQGNQREGLTQFGFLRREGHPGFGTMIELLRASSWSGKIPRIVPNGSSVPSVVTTIGFR